MKQEEITDFVDTASSQFYARQPRHSRKTSSKIYNDCSTLDSLEEQIAKIKETILSGQQLIKRLESNQELKSYVEETKQELKVVRARNINQRDSVKNSFQHNFAALERKLSSLKTNWANLKKKAEAQIEGQIQNFKQKIKLDQGQLSKTMKTTSVALKNKSNLLLQEVKETKKYREDSTSLLMQQIEQARVKYDSIAESERRKRSEYQAIVLGLLDRTVDQGEKLLRRIC